MIATLREPATAAPAAPGGGIPEVPARVAGTVSAVRVSAGFTSPHKLRVELAKGGTTVIDFEQAIIAAGFEPLTLPFIPASDPRIMDSTGALEVGEVPERLLILGGGIMGLEMATVYHELGAKVTIAELMDRPNAPPELATTLDTLDRLAADHITKAGVPHRSLTTVTVRTQRRGRLLPCPLLTGTASPAVTLRTNVQIAVPKVPYAPSGTSPGRSGPLRGQYG